MRMFLSLFVLLALCAGTPLAQTTTTTIQWDYLAVQLADVTPPNMTQVVRIDGVLQTTPPTCTQNVNKVDVLCTYTVTPALPSGSHTVRVEATKSGITKGTDIIGLNPGNAPPDPRNFRYQINITINVP